MGWNTTVVLLNDALHEIAEDPEFGKRLADAVSLLAVNKGPVDVSAHGRRSIHCNAATVIETHHADITVHVAVGQNYGQVVPSPQRAKEQNRLVVECLQMIVDLLELSKQKGLHLDGDKELILAMAKARLPKKRKAQLPNGVTL